MLPPLFIRIFRRSLFLELLYSLFRQPVGSFRFDSPQYDPRHSKLVPTNYLPPDTPSSQNRPPLWFAKLRMGPDHLRRDGRRHPQPKSCHAPVGTLPTISHAALEIEGRLNGLYLQREVKVDDFVVAHCEYLGFLANFCRSFAIRHDRGRVSAGC